MNFIRRWRTAIAASARRKIQPYLSMGWDEVSRTLSDSEKRFFRKVYKVLEIFMFGGMTGVLLWFVTRFLIRQLGAEVVLAIVITAMLTLSTIEDFENAGWFRL